MTYFMQHIGLTSQKWETVASTNSLAIATMRLQNQPAATSRVLEDTGDGSIWFRLFDGDQWRHATLTQ